MSFITLMKIQYFSTVTCRLLTCSVIDVFCALRFDLPTIANILLLSLVHFPFLQSVSDLSRLHYLFYSSGVVLLRHFKRLRPLGQLGNHFSLQGWRTTSLLCPENGLGYRKERPSQR